MKNYLTKTVIGLCLSLSIWFSASNTPVILAQNDSNMSSYEHVNVYTHRKNCNNCEYTTTQAHTLNNQKICTLCGGRGVEYGYNSNYEVQIK